MVITLTTNASQDAILERLRVKTNGDIAAQTPPGTPLADIPALVTYVMTNAVIDYRKQQLLEDAAAVDVVYMTGTNAQRTAIKTAAGL